MKAKNLRKMHRAIAANKSRKSSDVARISKMQDKVASNYDIYKKLEVVVFDSTSWAAR